ncbi:MAG: DUF4271 domain-containing protein [Bacteroidetes bacterium]|nr:DUF4271 domain-containing protein [Bacteroidota bacterium]MBK9415212.1 DUF4271 domain-containing protein [Bacteroidota bacterium]MBL0032807.1 DUF4271 domain-containing protein [Bacteroidota bacterium]MBP6428399.1 DUF4271 domain-containing protein [Bacteroidia bacterium]
MSVDSLNSISNTLSDTVTAPASRVLLTDTSGIASVNVDSALHTYWKTDSVIYFNDTLPVASKYTDIYKGHLLHPTGAEPIARSHVSPIWFFPIILVVLAVFAALRIFYNKYFSQMLVAFVNNNLTNQIVRDENILVQRASVYLSIVFNLIAALFLYLISVYYGWEIGGIGIGFSRFLFFAVIVSAAYTLKFLILKISGWLFNLDREMATYIFNTFLINNILGIALLPFVCLIAYNQMISASWLILIAVILAGTAFAYRMFRGVLVGLSMPSFSLLYLFLYLCTLEIAPLLILIRIIVS